MWSGPVRPPRPFRSKTVDASGARDDSLLYTRCTCVCVLRWEGKRAVQPRKQQKKNTCCLHCTVSRCSSTNPFTFCVFLISTRQRDSCAFVRCVGKAINQSEFDVVSIVLSPMPFDALGIHIAVCGDSPFGDRVVAGHDSAGRTGFVFAATWHAHQHGKHVM